MILQDFSTYIIFGACFRHNQLSEGLPWDSSPSFMSFVSTKAKQEIILGRTSLTPVNSLENKTLASSCLVTQCSLVRRGPEVTVYCSIHILLAFFLTVGAEIDTPLDTLNDATHFKVFYLCNESMQAAKVVYPFQEICKKVTKNLLASNCIKSGQSNKRKLEFSKKC